MKRIKVNLAIVVIVGKYSFNTRNKILNKEVSCDKIDSIRISRNKQQNKRKKKKNENITYA